MATMPQGSVVTTFPGLNQEWDIAKQSLQQTLISMQSALNALVGTQGLDQLTADWTDVPFIASAFVGPRGITGSTTDIIAQPAPYLQTFKIVGSIMFYNLKLSFDVQDITTARVSIALPMPAGVKVRHVPSNQGSTLAPLYFPTVGESGLAPNPCVGYIDIGIFQPVAPERITFQRTDGNVMPNTGNNQISCSIAIPIVPVTTSTVL